MQLFWKRTHEPDEKLANPSGPAPAENLLLDDADATGLEPRTEQIDVETVAGLLTDARFRVRRGFVFWLWMFASPLFALALIATIINDSAMWAIPWLLGLITARSIFRQASLLQQERAALWNSHLDNRWIGALAEALEWPERRVRDTASLLLTQFLPRLREGDGILLTDEQRGCVFRRLTPMAALRDPDLAVAIVKALPYVGTDEAHLLVARLASLPPVTAAMRRVHNAARASLAVLERRVALERSSATEHAAAMARNEPVTAMDLPAPSWAGSAAEETESGGAGLSPAEREELALVSAHVDAQMREFEEDLKRLRQPGMRHAFLIASWVVIVPYCAAMSWLQFSAGQWPLGLLLAGLTLLSTQLHRLALTDEHKVLARRLSKMNDPRCIGRLAEALEWPDEGIRRVAITALTRLLYRVKASDRVPLTAQQRGNLHRMLHLSNADRYQDFLLGILRALEQIGDASALPYVEQLARPQPVLGVRVPYRGAAAARQRRVREAAADCLEYLKQRAELDRSSQTLLRASSASLAGTDTLVRAVNSPGLTDQEQLLRAGPESPAA